MKLCQKMIAFALGMSVLASQTQVYAQVRNYNQTQDESKTVTFQANKNNKMLGTMNVKAQAMDTYTISYRKNTSGVSGEMNQQVVKRNNTVALRKCTFTKPGYHFKGWAKTKDGAVAYKDRTNVRNLAKAGGKIILYAVWEEDPKRRALVMSETATSRVVPNLDATSMAQMMLNCRFNGKKMTSVETYTNHTLPEIKQKIVDCFRYTTEDDISYLYFSCHGSKFETNGNKNVKILIDMQGQGFTPQELHDFLSKNVKGKVVLFFDCCYSGRVISNWKQQNVHLSSANNQEANDFASTLIEEFASSQPTNEKGAKVETNEIKNKYKILCSSRIDETSAGAWEQAHTTSLATEYWEIGCGWDPTGGELLSSGVKLDKMKADTNNDKQITLKELYNYSYPLISEKYAENNPNAKQGQHIQVYPQESNFVLFARN